MFKHRLISTIVLVPCIITILFLFSTLQLAIVTLFICMISAWEWGKLLHHSPNDQKNWLLLIFILLCVLLKICIHPNKFHFINSIYIIYAILTWWLIAILLIAYYPNSANLWNKSALLCKIFGMLIILPFFWGVLILRQYCYSENYYTGGWLLLYIIGIVWGMDSFSYIIGYKLGRHSPIPKISPNKTWEGYIGAIFIMIVNCFIFSKYIPINIEPSKLYLYSVIIILSSILGDLTESMFKRESGVKDSSQLIPGHGGILDTIDSLYSTIPICACLLLLTT
ncbi:phosphatidate cytidylyltransferase [Blochmannia endosymbiont of Polyrhachis (Hedomyrma) turneri]|uniref:phosphatidate cytidylyltransferase n=1 Tax=Blochmannia endosymbiont of Polyrhachis (Hedomyrma) turneri TaxID=1505596 RepID=UPI00061A5F33|nr:phosphatidate cytidylyltransferase [Blochmannia endosymbiont of Polyrhachis (Hedomyrma) turneri]AKC59860.1 phosphatidate cytidylyltransferase [Blochmannia endosymbiont of Polyrhachis (Hedomyrma) turneri]